jgi:hypothetical protein
MTLRGASNPARRSGAINRSGTGTAQPAGASHTMQVPPSVLVGILDIGLAEISVAGLAFVASFAFVVSLA